MAHDALRRKILTWLAVLPFSGKVIAQNLTATSPRDTSDEVAAPELALNVVRLFNTIEAGYKHEFNTYASKPELLGWIALRKVRNLPPKKRSGLRRRVNLEAESLLSGWHFQLHVSPQRDDYLLIMRSNEMVIASGDPGVIYYGSVLPETEFPESYAPLGTILPHGFGASYSRRNCQKDG